MIINWKELFERNDILIHCESETESLELLDIAHNFGYKWRSGDSYKQESESYRDLDNNIFDINEGTNDSYDNYLDSWYRHYYELIKFIDIVNGIRKPFKLHRKDNLVG